MKENDSIHHIDGPRLCEHALVASKSLDTLTRTLTRTYLKSISVCLLGSSYAVN